MANQPTVSVVIPVLNPGAKLSTIIRSIESDDLPYGRYQLVVVDQGSTDGSRERLTELARHRPNLTVVDEADPVAGLQAGVARAAGEYILQLDAADRLMPSGLSVLLDRVQADRPDVLLGRSAGSGPIGFLPETRYESWRRDDPGAAVGVLGPVALIRRSLLNDLLGSGPIGWRTTRLRLLSTAGSIVALTDPPVLVGAGPGTAESPLAVWRDVDVAAAELSDPASGPARARFIGAHAVATVRRFGDTLDSAAADLMADVVRRRLDGVDGRQLLPAQRGIVEALRAGSTVQAATKAWQPWSQLRLIPKLDSVTWVDGRLRLDATVTVPAPDGDLPGIEELSLVLLVREVETSTIHLVPCSTTRTRSAGDPSFRLEAAIDIATAAGGSPLRDGNWDVLIRLHGAGVDAPIGRSLPYARLGSALVDGRPVRPVSENGHLRLEVGASSSGFVGRRDAEDATITESAVGSLLTIRLRDLAVRGDADLAGTVFLGKFPLRATLRARAGRAQIECLVSGMAGASPVSARFGPAAREPLGLRLRISGSGDMAVRPDPQRGPGAAKPGTTREPADGHRPTSAGPAQTAATAARQAVRIAARALPDRVRRPARSLYRRILG